MEIPHIGFGTYRLFDTTKDSVLKALQEGYRHIDTAPLYKNEHLVGEALRETPINRKDIFLTTKISRNELKKNKIKESIENSLKQLQVDYIDLVLLHEPINHKENWKLLTEYYQQEGKNKIKYIGVSNFDEIHLQDIQEYMTPQYNQIEYNPFITQKKLVEYSRKKNITLVAHSPLAKAEKLDNPVLKQLALNYSKSCAQMMLRWSQQTNLVVIPRSNNLEHIQENLQLDFDINDSDIDILSSLNCNYATHPQYIRKIKNK